MCWKQYNTCTNRNLWSAYRPTVGDHRPNDGRYPASVCRRFFNKMSSTDCLAIVGQLTPDDRATFGRYYDEKSSKSRPIIGRPSPDASPMTKSLKIGGSVNETFNLGASKKSRRPTKNLPKSVLTPADNRPTSPDFPIFGSPTVGWPSVWVMWL